MAKSIPMIGKRFGRLTVIAESGRESNGGLLWICKCDCGQITKPISGGNLRRNIIKSCGCLRREIAIERGGTLNKTHGMYQSRLYHVWQGMIARCTNPKNPRYKYYGGRGIKVCDEWLNSFQAFHDWAMENGYKSDAAFGECTIDRIDVSGNYCPKNCRWITIAEQNRNTTRIIPKGGDCK